MNEGKGIYIILIIALISLAFTSCNSTTTKYYVAAKEFNKIYFDIVSCEDSKQPIKTLEEFSSTENMKKIEELSRLLDEIKINAPLEKERFYEIFKKRYEDLFYLVDTYTKYGKIDNSTRRKVNIILMGISMSVDEWNDKNSRVIWQ